MSVVAASLISTVLAGNVSDLSAGPDGVPIVGGTEVAACGWPNVVALGGVCTGTLIHPRVVVYAAHCGGGPFVVFAEDAVSGPTREVPTVFCKQLGREEGQLGRDFALCVLEEPQLDIPIVPPLMGCELDHLQPGTEVAVVGFGWDEDEVGGIKRELRASFHHIENDEAFIGGDGVDACLGDSGGPAFVRVPDPLGGPSTWRLFGIVSHGDPECFDGSYYGMVPRVMEWFEEASGFDLTPCTDAAGNWDPDGRCAQLPVDPEAATGIWPDGCSVPLHGQTVSTCGDPVEPGVDDLPPSVEIVDPADPIELHTDDQGLADLTALVEADDADGWGVAEVQIRVDGKPIPGGADGLPPYTFDLRFPPGLFELSASTRDYAGNEAHTDVVLVAIDESLPDDDAACTCTTTRRPWSIGWLLAVAFIPRRRRPLSPRRMV